MSGDVRMNGVWGVGLSHLSHLQPTMECGRAGNRASRTPTANDAGAVCTKCDFWITWSTVKTVLFEEIFALPLIFCTLKSIL